MKLWKPCSIKTPIEFATVNYDASKRSPMTANPFGSRMDDNVNSEVNRVSEESGGGECGIDL